MYKCTNTPKHRSKTLSVTLPDSLTTWEVQGVGISDKGRYCNLVRLLDRIRELFCSNCAEPLIAVDTYVLKCSFSG